MDAKYFLLLTLCIALPAHAEIYFCENKGVKVFQDKPCISADDGTAGVRPPDTEIAKTFARIEQRLLEMESNYLLCEKETEKYDGTQVLIACDLLDAQLNQGFIIKQYNEILVHPGYRPSPYTRGRLDAITARSVRILTDTVNLQVDREYKIKRIQKMNRDSTN